MNNICSANRFLRLWNKHTKEHYKSYLMSVAVLTGVLLMVFSVVAYDGEGAIPLGGQRGVFAFFLLISGTIFTSMVFTELGNQKQSIPALTLPVSHLERYLVAWIYSFIVFQLVYVACYYIVDIIAVNIGNNNPKVHNEIMTLDFHEKEIYVPYLAFLLLHAVSFFGAIYFEKMHFIKSAFAFFIALVAIILLNSALVHLIFNETVHVSAPFTGVFIKEKEQYFQLPPTDTGAAISLYMIFALVIILWTATYYKLKEKQV